MTDLNDSPNDNASDATGSVKKTAARSKKTTASDKETTQGKSTAQGDAQQDAEVTRAQRKPEKKASEKKDPRGVAGKVTSGKRKTEAAQDLGASSVEKVSSVPEGSAERSSGRNAETSEDVATGADRAAKAHSGSSRRAGAAKSSERDGESSSAAGRGRRGARKNADSALDPSAFSLDTTQSESEPFEANKTMPGRSAAKATSGRRGAAKPREKNVPLSQEAREVAVAEERSSERVNPIESQRVTLVEHAGVSQHNASQGWSGETAFTQEREMAWNPAPTQEKSDSKEPSALQGTLSADSSTAPLAAGADDFSSARTAGRRGRGRSRPAPQSAATSNVGERSDFRNGHPKEEKATRASMTMAADFTPVDAAENMHKAPEAKAVAEPVATLGTASPLIVADAWESVSPLTVHDLWEPADSMESQVDIISLEAGESFDAGESQDSLDEAEATASAGGEKRRRSRSRRGRGRKRATAADATGATPDDEESGAGLLDADLSGDSDSGLVVLEDDEDILDKDDDKDSEKSKAAAEQRQNARRKMFVSVQPEEQVEVVLTEEGQVQEYYVEMLHQAKTKGNIYKAIIHNIDPNLQAAFVSYGAARNGFLQIDEVHPEYYIASHEPGRGRKYPPVQKVLKAGQEVLVQVVKEPSGTKGAFLTTYLSMPGRFLVLTPGREQIGVSRKVEHEEERARLRDLLEGLNPGPGLGVIVRTVSMGASKANLQRDLQNLQQVWKEVRTRGGEETAPALIYQEMDLTTRAVRDYLTEQVVEVWLDDEKTADAITLIADILFPNKKNLVRVHKESALSLFDRFNLQKQLDQIQSREVVLPSGGRLVFDATEALTAIDINSGRSGGKTNFEDMAYRTNMEAAKMIPLQLRLRDIGGQVVADFIEMRDRSHWREVERTLRAGMKIDRARYDVGKIGPFGMLEIVRQRLGSSAISISTEPCPHCKGTGVRRNLEWQSQQALRDIQRLMRAAQGQEPATVVYEADSILLLHLLNSKRQRLVEMEQNYSVTLEIRPKEPAGV